MPVIHLDPKVEVQILPSPVMFRVLSTNRFLSKLEGAEPNGSTEYATVTVDEATGSVSCQSGFGDFAYSWSRSGRGADVFTFLASLGFDYFMGKAAKQPFEILDLDRTIENYRQEIRLERRGNRRHADLSKDQANEMWEALDTIASEAPRDAQHFYHLWSNSALAEWFVDDSPSLRFKIAPCAQRFWDELWRPLMTSPQFIAHMSPRAERAA